MALDTFLPEFFSQEFTPAEMFEFPYLQMAIDRSAMIPDGGHQVTWPDVEGSVTTQGYTRGTTLTDGEGRDIVYTLTSDQNRAVAIPLDDLDRIRRMPQVMGQYTVQANRELMWEMNAFVRGVYQRAARRAASGLAQPMRGSHNGLASNVKRLEFLTDAGTGNAHAKLASEQGRQQLIASMDEDAGGFAKRHGWVTESATVKGVAVVPIEIGNQFRRYLTDDKPNLGAGSIVDSAFGFGRVMMIQGWEILEDVTLPAHATATAGNPAYRINFMHPQRMGLYYARQLATMETERIQGQFGTRLKALSLYGGTQGAARHIYGIDIQLSAS